jgi:hypothetical protein
MSTEHKFVNSEVASSAGPARTGARALNQPASFWVASVASLGVIVGGVGPWATYMNYVSISGTSMHGWREVAVGVIALVLLGVYQLCGWRTPAVVAAILGLLGVIGAIADLRSITSGGAITVFGITYRYLNASWGIYLVLTGTIILMLSASVLACTGARAWLGRFRSAGGPDTPQP